MMKKRIVIKLGGSTLNSTQTLQRLATLVRGLQSTGHQVILVHGGGPAVNAELTKRQITWKFIDGQRQTTPEMISIIEEVLAKKVNSMLVESMRDAEMNAIGISGAAGLLFCRQASPELMQVGEVQSVNREMLESLLNGADQPLPVIAPIGIGSDGQKYNINADWAAAQIAIAVRAKKLIFLTDQDGVLDQNRQLVVKAKPSMLQLWMAQGVIAGGMSTKVKAMMAALSAGVLQVRVLNANSADDLLADENIGTLLRAERSAKISGESTVLKKGVSHVRAS